MPVTSVHLLSHVHNEDEKLIGVYATNADAVAAKERLRQQPGFVDTPEGLKSTSMNRTKITGLRGT